MAGEKNVIAVIISLFSFPFLFTRFEALLAMPGPGPAWGLLIMALIRHPPFLLIHHCVFRV